MPLDTHVTDRYSAQYMVNITNPDLPGGTASSAIDTGRLDLAVIDVMAKFETWGQVAYDDTDPQHIEIAVAGVVATLLARGSAGSAGESAMADFRRDLEQLARVQPRRRVTPTTYSRMQPTFPSRERPTSPDFDRSKFRDMQLGSRTTRNLDGG